MQAKKYGLLLAAAMLGAVVIYLWLLGKGVWGQRNPRASELRLEFDFPESAPGQLHGMSEAIHEGLAYITQPDADKLPWKHLDFDNPISRPAGAVESSDGAYLAFMVVQNNQGSMVVREKSTGQEQAVPIPAYVRSHHYAPYNYRWYKESHVLMIAAFPANDPNNRLDEKNYFYRYDADTGQIRDGLEVNKHIQAFATGVDEFLIARGTGGDEHPAILIEVYDRELKLARSITVPMMLDGGKMSYGYVALLPINQELWVNCRIGEDDHREHWLFRINYAKSPARPELIFPGWCMPIWSADESRLAFFKYHEGERALKLETAVRGSFSLPRIVWSKTLDDGFHYYMPQLDSITSSGTALLVRSHGIVHSVPIR